MDLIEAFLVYGVRSDQALPKSPDTQKLVERVAAIANPAPEPISIPPVLAETVNGKLLVLDSNELGWETVLLELKPEQAWLSVKTDKDTEARIYAIGLDGRYLLTKTTPSTVDNGRHYQRNFLNPYEFDFLVGMPVDGAVAMKGKALTDSIFKIVVQHTQDMDLDEITFTLSPNGATIIWNSFLEGRDYYFFGKW